MTSTDLKNGWVETKTLPVEMSKVPSDPTWADLKPYIPAPQGRQHKAPGVFFSSTPAELIVFDGQPVYATIPGTQLVFAKITDSDVFVYSPSKTYYYLEVAERTHVARERKSIGPRANCSFPVHVPIIA